MNIRIFQGLVSYKIWTHRYLYVKKTPLYNTYPRFYLPGQKNLRKLILGTSIFRVLQKIYN